MPKAKTGKDIAKKQAGRKGKYDKWLEEQNLVLIEGWARDGLTEEQIAHNMGIACSTLRDWKDKFPAISEALKNGKEVADYYVENALYRSALGYYVDEEEDKLDVSGNVVPTKKRRWIQPNTTAQIYWLKNRRPDKWRDKPADAADQSQEGMKSFLKALAPTDDDIRELYEEQQEETNDEK